METPQRTINKRKIRYACMFSPTISGLVRLKPTASETNKRTASPSRTSYACSTTEDNTTPVGDDEDGAVNVSDDGAMAPELSEGGVNSGDAPMADDEAVHMLALPNGK